MPLYLKTRGQPTLGIGICQRCQTKVMLAELRQDPNMPGFWTCGKRGCVDQYDPMRLPPPPPDKINLPLVRPDVPLETPLAEQAPLEPPSQYD